MNKGNVIEIRCKKCNKLMMEYFVCGNDSAVALQNIGIKCDRCKRVMILKKYSEAWLSGRSGTTIITMFQSGFYLLFATDSRL